MKTLLIVRPANDNLFILPFHQSNKVVACDLHCFNNCLISKVCAQISNSLSYTQISKRPSATIILNDGWLIENFKGKAADRILSVLFLG